MANKPKQMKQRYIILINMIVILAIGVLVFYIARSVHSAHATRLLSLRSPISYLAEYKVIETSTLEELWAISNVFATQRYGNGLIATNGSLYIIGNLSGQRLAFLNRLDLATGQQVWEVSDEIEASPVSTFNSNYIFIGAGARGRVTAYELESGNIAWKKSLSLIRTRHIFYMSAVGSDLYVNRSGSTGFNILDIKNGRIQERGYTRGVFPIFFATGDIIYHGRFGEFLVASNKVTNDILWEVEFEKEIVQAPLFIDDIVLVRTDKSGFLGEVFAIDLATGKILWSSPRNIVSNVTAANNVAYYLTEDSHLIAVDILTGEMVGSVEFSPKITALEPIDQVNEDFSVAAYDEIVVVYFGSGSQLFAFRFLGSSE